MKLSKQTFRLERFGLCAALLLSVLPAKADTLAAPVVSGTEFFNLTPPEALNFNTFGTFPLTDPGGELTFTASALPSPLLSAQALISANFTGRSSGILTYEMEVLGPAGNVS